MNIEAARIDNPKEEFKAIGKNEVWVYGNDSSVKTPHFHYLVDRGGAKYDIEVKIEDLTICNGPLTWEDIDGGVETLLAWLELPNSDLPMIDNFTALKVSWNQNNRDNQVE